MDPNQYIRLLQRWLWLVLLAAFIGGSFSFITRTNQTPMYRSMVTIIVGSALESPNPNTLQIQTGIDLAYTYAEIIRTYDLLQIVADRLNLSLEPDELAGMIETRIISGTSLLQIIVTYSDPVLAADITNELARQLILQSPSNLTPAQQQQVSLLNDQIEAQTAELITLREQLREVDETLLQNTLSEEARNSLRNQRTTLVDQINEASANIGQFTNTIASFQQRTNSVEIVETARIPTSPIGSSVMSSVILGAGISGLIALAAVVAYEYLNDTFRNTDDVIRVLNLPVLGVISRFGARNDGYQKRLISSMPAINKTAEEYRTLRTNLMFSTEAGNRLFIISSTSPQEGKSLTAANLAISLAQSGLRVLLIDADLRRPKVHEAFQLENSLGLTTLLNAVSAEGEGGMLSAETWRKVIQRSKVPNLYIIPSGFHPANPSELLGSALMRRWIEQIRKGSIVDLIILDTPPALAVSDSVVLAASLKARVVLIVQANRTRQTVARRTKERFEQVGADIAGVVLNGTNPREEDYYGYDYSYYYTRPEEADSV